MVCVLMFVPKDESPNIPLRALILSAFRKKKKKEKKLKFSKVKACFKYVIIVGKIRFLPKTKENQGGNLMKYLSFI